MGKTIKLYKQPETIEQIKFGQLELECRSRKADGSAKLSDYEIKVYRCALGDDDTMHLLDVVGAASEILALRAAMGKSVTSKFTFRGCTGVGQWRNPAKCEKGYRFHTEAIGGRVGGKQMVHFVAISNAPGFMPYVTPHALAKCLATDAFTTPFLSPDLHGEGCPDWVPYLMQQLLDRDCLKYLDCFNCNAGILKPRESEIENIVSVGVSSGALPWIPYDLEEIAAANKDLKAEK